MTNERTLLQAIVDAWNAQTDGRVSMSSGLYYAIGEAESYLANAPEPAATQLEGECPNCRQWVVLRSDEPAVDRGAEPT